MAAGTSLDELERLLSSGDGRCRREALVRLSRLDPDERSLALARKVLLHDDDPEICFAAGSIYDRWRGELGEVDDPLVPPLYAKGELDRTAAASILEGASQYCKLVLVKAIAGKEDRSALDLLLKAAETERDRFVLSALLRVIGSLGGEDSAHFLRRFVKHDDPRVRANAVAALGQVSGKALLGVLPPLLEDDDPAVRAEVSELLEETDPRKARRIVMLLGNSDETVKRRGALSFIETMAPPWSEELLLPMVEAEDDAELLKKECVLLARYGTARSIPGLLELADSAAPGRRALFEKTVEKLRKNIGVDDLGMDPAPSAGHRAVWRSVGPVPKRSRSSLLQFIAPILIGTSVFLLAVGIVLWKPGAHRSADKPRAAPVPAAVPSRRNRASKLSAEQVKARNERRALARARERRRRERLARMDRKRRRRLSVARRPRRWGRRGRGSL